MHGSPNINYRFFIVNMQDARSRALFYMVSCVWHIHIISGLLKKIHPSSLGKCKALGYGIYFDAERGGCRKTCKGGM